MTTGYMHLNTKPGEQICSRSTPSAYDYLACKTDLQLSVGNIVEVKVIIGVDLAYLVGGQFSGYLNASSAGA